MRPPEILNRALPLVLPQEQPKPRTALADWLVDSRNPLTARVLANRVWQYHFGNGIVNTPNDFGYYGDRPSHPKLLDYLASELLESGWRLKPLHRTIMLSSAYRQSSSTPMSELAREIDPRTDCSGSSIVGVFRRRKYGMRFWLYQVLLIRKCLAKALSLPLKKAWSSCSMTQTNGRLPRTNVSTIVVPCT